MRATNSRLQSVAVSRDPSATEVLGEKEKSALNEMAAKQNVTGDGIEKYVDIKTENREVNKRTTPTSATGSIRRTLIRAFRMFAHRWLRTSCTVTF